MISFTMKYITNILKNLIPKEKPKPMGRWSIDYCNTKMNKKIDMANEDHCGPCGQYAINKMEIEKEKIHTVEKDKSLVLARPF